MGENTFELGDNDAAIIFKQDMSTEIVLPQMADEDAISFEEHQNMFVAIAISGSMGDDDFRAVISAKLDTMFKETNPTCGEDKEGLACGGGCCGPTSPEPCKPGDCEVDVTEGDPED